MKTVSERTVCTEDAFARIQRIREECRFNYIGPVTICAKYHFKDLSVSGKRICAAGRKTSGSRDSFSLFLSEKGGKDGFRNVLSDVPIGNSTSPVCFTADGKRIVFPRLIDGEIRLQSQEIDGQDVTVFDRIPGVKLRQISSTQANGHNITIADELAHVMAEYDENGRYLRSIPLPEGYEYPIRIATYHDGNYLVAFGQGHHRRLNPEFSRCDKPLQSFLVIMGSDGRIIRDQTEPCRYLFEGSPIRGIGTDSSGNVYVLVAGCVAKIDESGRKIFEAEVRRPSQDGDENDHLWKTWTVADMRFSDGRLYVLGNSSESVIHVFDVKTNEIMSET